MKFWIIWGFDAIVAAVWLYFFLVGLYDGSVSSFNAGLWLVILLVLAGVLGGSILLRSGGHPTIALVLLVLFGIPNCLAGAFFLLILLMKPRWN